MKEKIRSYLSSLINREEELSDAEDFFQNGSLNSMFKLQLVNFLEQEFKINIQNDDLELNNFNTIEHIVQFVQKKQAAQAAST